MSYANIYIYIYIYIFFFFIYMMMAQSQAESTRDTSNYGQYKNQFPPNTIKAIQEYERIQKKICRQKMSIMFNKICINEEMLPNIYICLMGFINHSPMVWETGVQSQVESYQ